MIAIGNNRIGDWWRDSHRANKSRTQNPLEIAKNSLWRDFYTTMSGGRN